MRLLMFVAMSGIVMGVAAMMGLHAWAFVMMIVPIAVAFRAYRRSVQLDDRPMSRVVPHTET